MVTHDSIRQKVYRLWVENPYITAQPACKKLKLDFKKRGNYINKLLSEFRSYYSFGSPQEPHVPHRRVFVWECIPRAGSEPGKGWREVSNRNQMWIYKGDRGSVHWYRGGLVRLYLKGPVVLARAKQLFANAFSFLSNDELMKYLEAPLREESKHWVFELGQPVPRFDIRQFERSHGIRIFADGSHPTALEVEETEPFWIQQFSDVVNAFGQNIQEHLKLIKEWQEEARNVRRRKRGGWVKGRWVWE